jgi:hypothetical protein
MLSVCGIANASLIKGDFLNPGDGYLITDTSTGFQWLTPYYTRGQTYDDTVVQNLIATYGLRYATYSEASSMIDNNFGNPPQSSPGTPAGFADAQAFFNLFGINEQVSCGAPCPRTQGLTSDPGTSGAHLGIGMIQLGSNGWEITQNNWPDSVADVQMGSFLVRSTNAAAAAPEPATWATLALSFGVLGAFARRFRKAVGLLALCLLAMAPASHASTILSIAMPAGGCCSSLGGQNQQISMEGWTDSSPESNVSIQAVVGEFGAGSSITAYLMNQVGPGTTTGNQIATTTFTPGSSFETDTLFSGLFLPAGSYYLVLTGNATNNQGWGFVNSGTDPITTAATVSSPVAGVVNVIPGNSHGTPDAYAPASTFFSTTFELSSFGQSVLVQTATPAPEPGTLATAGVLLGALGWWKRRALLLKRGK